MEFKPFQSIARLSREIVITEKIDGTNASITITEDGGFLTGSRSRWITPQDDNYGFSKWAHDNRKELMKLGVGTHYGEWWGKDIQRKYATEYKIFSLFNIKRWLNNPEKPLCCDVVPVLYLGDFDTNKILETMQLLQETGSMASRGFMKPEGIVIYHIKADILFKKTFKDDEKGKTYGH